MKRLILITVTSLFLSACSGSPPKPNEPKGNWYQINSSHYYEENANKTINTQP